MREQMGHGRHVDRRNKMRWTTPIAAGVASAVLLLGCRRDGEGFTMRSRDSVIAQALLRTLKFREARRRGDVDGVIRELTKVICKSTAGEAARIDSSAVGELFPARGVMDATGVGCGYLETSSGRLHGASLLRR